MNYNNLRLISVILLLASYSNAFFSGCTVQLVPEYDENIKNKIIRLTGEVEFFYAELAEMNVNERTFEKFRKKYIAIEVDLRKLLIRNKIRPLNNESVRQTERVLEKTLSFFIGNPVFHRRLAVVYESQMENTELSDIKSDYKIKAAEQWNFFIEFSESEADVEKAKNQLTKLKL